MKNVCLTLITLFLSKLAFGTEVNIIPRPAQIELAAGSFIIKPTANILYEGERAQGVARQLAEQLWGPEGRARVHSTANKKAETDGDLVLRINSGSKTDLGSEAYQLTIAPNRVTMQADTYNGLFYATRSLLQLLPANVFSDEKKSKQPRELPCLKIIDAPTFQWRGYMLDVARHFFPKETIFRLIDQLSLYKINRFHLHLTDDQGWRVQIDRFPRLTEMGAWQILENGEKRGGYYTKEDLREIVAYAEKRAIMIIPEIGMPGHSVAAVASYPELSCRGVQIPVKTEAGVSPDTMCPANEKVDRFVAGVFDEIIGIFPSPYIHIGGDEAMKHEWLKCERCTAAAGVQLNPTSKEDKQKVFDLQGAFIGRVNRMLKERGKTMIGWDEILDHGADGNMEGAIIHSWRSPVPGLKAAAMGQKVIMSPSHDLYLDYPNGRRPLERMYLITYPDRQWKAHFNESNILGVEAALWTESVAQENVVSYLTWPRMWAIAEVGWTPIDKRNLRDFMHRVTFAENRFDAMGVKYKRGRGDHMVGVWHDYTVPENEELRFDITGVIDKPGNWEFVFNYEGGGGMTTDGFKILQGDEVIGAYKRVQQLGWRDSWAEDFVKISEKLDPAAKQTLCIKLKRGAEQQGGPMGGMGSVWLSFRGD